MPPAAARRRLSCRAGAAPASASADSIRRTIMKARVLVVAVLSALALGVPASASVGVLHSFAGPEGETPAAALVQGFDGILYGVAAHGGDFAALPPDGGGTIFRTDLAGNLTTLHAFTGLDGAVPTGIVRGRDGAFYGTTTYGGEPGISALTPGNGTIYRIDTAGNLTVLFVFPGSERGYRPGPLMQGSDGALYGTAVGGSSLYARFPGIVYRFDPATGDYRILHTFIISDGRDPTGKLFGASDGLFYGTLESGGYGGRIFRMDAAGNLTILFSFGPYSADGWRPIANPIEASDGFFYGTTPRGGTSPTGSYGVVYRLSRSGSLSVMHSFSGPDGIEPGAALVQASDGWLYGSAIVGGAYGLGTLFRLDPAQPTPLPTPQWLYVDPPGVVGGSTATGTLTLTWAAPPGGAVVSLSSDSSLASVPPSITVPAGLKTASFPVATKRTKKTRVATITAGYNGSQTTGTVA